MKKIASFNIVAITTLAVVLYCVYSVLLHDSFLHTSIASIISRADHLQLKMHLTVLGLIPIYIATVIFGSAMIGIYIGSRVQHILISVIEKR